MEKRKKSGFFWYCVYIALFAVSGAACLCLDRIYDYTIPMTVWGSCWLVLAAGAVLAAPAVRRSGRDFQPLLQCCTCGMLGAAGLYQGLAGKDAFYQFLGVLWLGLAAAWLIRAVRGFREDETPASPPGEGPDSAPGGPGGV